MTSTDKLVYVPSKWMFAPHDWRGRYVYTEPLEIFTCWETDISNEGLVCDPELIKLCIQDLELAQKGEKIITRYGKILDSFDIKYYLSGYQRLLERYN